MHKFFNKLVVPNNCSTLPSDNEDHKASKPQSIKYKAKLCEIASQVTGITFKNINKRWLRDNIFIYTAKVITKTISLNLELTVVFMVCENRKTQYSVINFFNVVVFHPLTPFFRIWMILKSTT